VADAFVGMADSVDAPQSARIAGEGIFSANECRIGLDGKHLYVNETFAHQLCRFPLAADGTLGLREVVAQFDEDTIPDGLTLDAEGGLWITGVAANRIVRVMPDGTWCVVAEDCDEEHMVKIRAAVRTGTLDRALLYDNHARILPNVTSIAFGGPAMRTAYVGSVSGTRIAVFESPIAGAVPVHWEW
jgi:sugar lactone lactonase YvrE